MKQRMLEIIARKHGHRAFARKSARDQGLADRARAGERLGITERAPAPVRRALREQHALGCLLRPVQEPVGDAFGPGPEPVWRAQQERTVCAPLERHLGRSESHPAKRRGRGARAHGASFAIV